MSPESIATLEKYRHKYRQWTEAQSLTLQPEEREEILQVIRREWDPGYTVMGWCGHCVAKMLEFAYNKFNENA